MQKIPWEHTTNGLLAHVKPRRVANSNNLAHVMGVALRKMDAVRFISAKFSGSQVLFEPLVGVLFDSMTHADFLGVYGLSDERDPVETPERIFLPDFCLRKVSWDQGRDIPLYKEAIRKKVYIQDKQEIDAVSVFVSSEMYPELFRLVKALRENVQQGISFSPTQRDTPVWNSVQVNLFGAEVDMQIHYNLRIQRSLALEQWLMQWYDQISQIDDDRGILPEGNFFISYQRSLFEMIETFPN